jgi:Ca-activated chloride channel family protein
LAKKTIARLPDFIVLRQEEKMRCWPFRKPNILKALAFLLALLAGAGLASSHKSADSDVSTPNGVSLSLAPAGSTREDSSHIQVTADLVQIPVTVTDKMDQVISDLDRNSFLVYENGVEQTIVHFGLEEAPVSACLVFDSSNSMAGKLMNAVGAVNQILDTAISEDEYCLVRFSSWPEVMVRLTSNTGRVAAAMRRIYAAGWTALLDAVYLGMQEVRHGRNQHKAIILISDGGDNRSRHSERQIKELVREADVQIYSIGVESPENHGYGEGEIDGLTLMKNISRQSGGRLYQIHGTSTLPETIAKIEMALRHQYVLGYYPKETHNDGQYRRVAIKLVRPKSSPSFRAYWRSGYYAPTQ